MIDEAVRRACERRGVTRACHFTQSRSLAHILTDPVGVRCVAELEADAPDVLNANDPLRLDRRRTHINCSIEYPNTWMLRRARDRERMFREWVVLLLDPQVLWFRSTLFAPRNAAACVPDHAGGVAGFEAVYADRIRGAGGRTFSRTPSMLSCCPTDDQAEALVAGRIERFLIRAVAVYSEAQAELERGRLSFLPDAAEVTWVVAPALFDGSWSDAVRRGRRPPEHTLSLP